MDELFAGFNLRKLGANLGLVGARSTPADLLSKFKSSWETILHESKSESQWASSIERTRIPGCLSAIIDVLVKEQATSNATDTGAATELFFNDDILGHLVALSENDVPVGFTSNVVVLIQPRFLSSHALIQRCLQSKEPLFHAALLELEVNLCTKIESAPELLPLFIDATSVAPKSTPDASGTGPRDSTATTSFSFSMLDHVMKYLINRGENGDRARTACRILFDLASEGSDLEEFIMSKNYTLELVAGLSGLFAQLPPVMPDLDNRSYRTQERAAYARRIFALDRKSFVNFIDFLQGILVKCQSPRISASIIDSARTIFFGNVLVASINSGSDFDGSALTTLRYLLDVANAIYEPRLSDCLVKTLLGGDAQASSSADTDGADDLPDASKAPRESKSQEPDMSLSVREVLLPKLNSLSEEVVTTTLRLLYVLMCKHTRTAFPLLFERMPKDPLASKALSSGEADADMQNHLTLISKYFELMPEDVDVSTVPSVSASADQPPWLSFATGGMPPQADLFNRASLAAYIQDAHANFVMMRLGVQSEPVDMAKVFRTNESLARSGSDEALSPTPVDPSIRGSRSRGNGHTSTWSMHGLIHGPVNSISRAYSINSGNFEDKSLIHGVAAGSNGAVEQPALLLHSHPRSRLTHVVEGDEPADDDETIAPPFYYVLLKCSSKSRSGVCASIGLTNASRPDFDEDAVFLRNVVVLHEFIKELVATLMTRGGLEMAAASVA
ncbi:Retinoic acid induced 16-like protein-domain-containing protein [Entophlyctis helioformis]|nr:Retinoic acid induced 16-like protein-domain-containing protein [Entophlyctis helioformis]